MRQRAEAIKWAQQMVSDPGTVYLDTETTGLLRDDAEIIEISVVDSSGVALLDTLVRPSRSIPIEATDVHGITDEMVAGAPLWSDIYGHLMSVVRGRHVVIYNRDFDYRFINHMNNRHNLQALANVAWHCAMKEYARYAGVWDYRRRSFKWHKLEHAHRVFSEVQVSSHRAIDDARACLIVVQGMAGSE